MHLLWDRLCARTSISNLVSLYSKPEAGGLIKSRFTDKGNVALTQGWQASGLGSSHSSALLLRKEISAVRGQEEILSFLPLGQGACRHII